MTDLYDSGRELGIAQESTVSNKYLHHAQHFNLGQGMTPRTNRSGSTITSGNVLVDDPATAGGVTTTVVVGDLRTVYVVPRLIGTDDVAAAVVINADDKAPLYGPGAYVPHCDLDAAAVSVDEYLKHSTTAKKLTGTGVIARAGTLPPPGACAIAKASKGAGASQIAVQLIETVRPTMQGFDYATQVNTAAEQTVLSTTIRANSMGANGFFRGSVVIFARNGSGAARIFTLRLKFGGVTLITFSWTVGSDADATKRAYLAARFVIRNTTAGAQLVWLEDIGSDTPTAVNTVLASLGDANAHNTGAIDTTTDQTLEVTAQMAVADANLQWYLVDGVCEGPFYSA